MFTSQDSEEFLKRAGQFKDILRNIFRKWINSKETFYDE